MTRTFEVSCFLPRLAACAAFVLLATVTSVRGGRVAYPQEKMTEAQKKALAEYKAIRGTEPNGPPWALLLRVPSLLVPSLDRSGCIT